MGSDGWQDRLNAALRRNWQWARKLPSYQTELTPAQEGAFRTWVANNKVEFNPDEPVTDYDMRGYWLAHQAGQTQGTQVNPQDGKLHFPDTFKTPYDATFSNQSQYALPNAPVWINDSQLADPKTGQILFDEKAAAAAGQPSG
ncbi:MAG: hypothetical protein ACREQ5_16235 [Candidatus Dormibacteria bacterium]